MSHKINDARERLLTEGKKILIESGFDRLNIRKLVKRCGIATGTFYNNFRCKEELTVEILKIDWNQIINSIDNVSSMQIQFKSKLEKIYSLVYAFFHNYKNVFIEMLMKSTPAKNNNIEIKRTFCNKMSCLLKSEIANGTLRTSLDTDKLSYIILQNFIYMSKEDYITFDEFYQFLNLNSINEKGRTA